MLSAPTPPIKSSLCACATAGKCILRTTLCCSWTRSSHGDGGWTSAPAPGRVATSCSSSATSTSTSQPTSSTPAGSTRSPVRDTHTHDKCCYLCEDSHQRTAKHSSAPRLCFKSQLCFNFSEAVVKDPLAACHLVPLQVEKCSTRCCSASTIPL